MSPSAAQHAVPQEVLDAFGLSDSLGEGSTTRLAPLEGGQGTSVLADSTTVLKPLGDDAQALDHAEADLIAQLCAALSSSTRPQPSGSAKYRVVRPLARVEASCTPSGGSGSKYVAHGWTATAYLPDLDARDIYDFSSALGAPGSVELEARARLPSILRASRAFHADVRAWVDARTRASSNFPVYVRSIIAGRDHVWAQTDRLVWGEYNEYFEHLTESEQARAHEAGTAVGLIPPSVADERRSSLVLEGVAAHALRPRIDATLRPMYDTLLRLQRPLRLDPDDVYRRSQLIHGDLAGNVLFPRVSRATMVHPQPSLVPPPAVLDVSPYWRPIEAAEGILAADFLIYFGATAEDLYEALGPINQFHAQMIVKGLLFRLISNSARRPDPGLAPHYHRAVQVASKLVDS